MRGLSGYGTFAKHRAREFGLLPYTTQSPSQDTFERLFHKSQKVEQRFRDGSIQLSLKVVINNELERLILGYGGHAEVIAAPEFRARIAESVTIAGRHYDCP